MPLSSLLAYLWLEPTLSHRHYHDLLLSEYYFHNIPYVGTMTELYFFIFGVVVV